MNTKSYKRDKSIIRYQLAIKKLSKFLQKYFCLILSCLMIISLINFDLENWNFIYSDCDGYMRAVRIYNWLLNPSFFEQLIYQSNYPFGEINHWTRPMDILWLINTLPFLKFFEIKDAVFMGGVLLSPWLFIISALTLVYGLRRQFNIYLTMIGSFLFISNPLIFSYYEIGRADHHSLLSLLSIYTMSLVLCWLKKRHIRYLKWIGFSLALMTFTGIEGIIIFALIIAFYLYLYIYKNTSLTASIKISKYFALFCTLFWLLNPPYQGWFYPDNGRLSVLFVTTAWLMTGTFYGLNISHLHTRSVKIWSLICSALGIAVFLLLIFGTQIYDSPLNNQIRDIWSSYISEMRPFWKQSLLDKIAIYTFAGISLIIAFWMLPKKAYNRLMIFTIIIGLPLFILNILALRFCAYQFLYNILPWLCLIDDQYKKYKKTHPISAEFPGSISFLILSIFLIQQLLIMPANLKSKTDEQIASLSPQTLFNIKNIGGTIVTDNFLSPYYIWECNVNTVGTAYHRNQNGIIDNHTLLNATNDNQIIPLLLKHQVTQILIFDNYNSYYDMDPSNQQKLYYRLIKRENIPSYLKEIPSTDKNTRHYRIKI